MDRLIEPVNLFNLLILLIFINCSFENNKKKKNLKIVELPREFTHDKKFYSAIGFILFFTFYVIFIC